MRFVTSFASAEREQSVYGSGRNLQSQRTDVSENNRRQRREAAGRKQRKLESSSHSKADRQWRRGNGDKKIYRRVYGKETKYATWALEYLKAGEEELSPAHMIMYMGFLIRPTFETVQSGRKIR